LGDFYIDDRCVQLCPAS
jgi:hypothetical protein